MKNNIRAIRTDRIHDCSVRATGLIELLINLICKEGPYNCCASILLEKIRPDSFVTVNMVNATLVPKV